MEHSADNLVRSVRLRKLSVRVARLKRPASGWNLPLRYWRKPKRPRPAEQDPLEEKLACMELTCTPAEYECAETLVELPSRLDSPEVYIDIDSPEPTTLHEEMDIKTEALPSAGTPPLSPLAQQPQGREQLNTPEEILLPISQEEIPPPFIKMEDRDGREGTRLWRVQGRSRHPAGYHNIAIYRKPPPAPSLPIDLSKGVEVHLRIGTTPAPVQGPNSNQNEQLRTAAAETSQVRGPVVSDSEWRKRLRAALEEIQVQIEGRLWAIDGRSSNPFWSRLGEDLIKKVQAGDQMSDQDIADLQEVYGLTVAEAVERLTTETLAGGRPMPAYCAHCEKSWPPEHDIPCPTCRRTGEVPILGPMGPLPRAISLPHDFAGAIAGTQLWVELPSCLIGQWANLNFTTLLPASIDGELEETGLYQGLKARLASMGTRTDLPLLLEYPADNDKINPRSMTKFIRIVAKAQKLSTIPVILVLPPIPPCTLPSHYQVTKMIFSETARRLRLLGRALAVPVFIPFVHSFVTKRGVALAPASLQSLVLYSENGTTTWEYHFRLRTSLLQLRACLSKYLITPTRWADLRTASAQ